MVVGDPKITIFDFEEEPHNFTLYHLGNKLHKEYGLGYKKFTKIIQRPDLEGRMGVWLRGGKPEHYDEKLVDWEYVEREAKRIVEEHRLMTKKEEGELYHLAKILHDDYGVGGQFLAKEYNLTKNEGSKINGWLMKDQKPKGHDESQVNHNAVKKRAEELAKKHELLPNEGYSTLYATVMALKTKHPSWGGLRISEYLNKPNLRTTINGWITRKPEKYDEKTVDWNKVSEDVANLESQTSKEAEIATLQQIAKRIEKEHNISGIPLWKLLGETSLAHRLQSYHNARRAGKEFPEHLAYPEIIKEELTNLAGRIEETKQKKIKKKYDSEHAPERKARQIAREKENAILYHVATEVSKKHNIGAFLVARALKRPRLTSRLHGWLRENRLPLGYDKSIVDFKEVEKRIAEARKEYLEQEQNYKDKQHSFHVAIILREKYGFSGVKLSQVLEKPELLSKLQNWVNNNFIIEKYQHPLSKEEKEKVNETVSRIEKEHNLAELDYSTEYHTGLLLKEKYGIGGVAISTMMGRELSSTMPDWIDRNRKPRYYREENVDWAKVNSEVKRIAKKFKLPTVEEQKEKAKELSNIYHVVKVFRQKHGFAEHKIARMLKRKELQDEMGRWIRIRKKPMGYDEKYVDWNHVAERVADVEAEHNILRPDKRKELAREHTNLYTIAKKIREIYPKLGEDRISRMLDREDLKGRISGWIRHYQPKDYNEELIDKKHVANEFNRIQEEYGLYEGIGDSGNRLKTSAWMGLRLEDILEEYLKLEGHEGPGITTSKKNIGDLEKAYPDFITTTGSLPWVKKEGVEQLHESKLSRFTAEESEEQIKKYLKLKDRVIIYTLLGKQIPREQLDKTYGKNRVTHIHLGNPHFLRYLKRRGEGFAGIAEKLEALTAMSRLKRGLYSTSPGRVYNKVLQGMRDQKRIEQFKPPRPKAEA